LRSKVINSNDSAAKAKFIEREGGDVKSSYGVK
jgi:hypothetical protein